GRTGRAGEKGKAITLIEANDWNQMSSIERYLKIRFERRTVKGLAASYSGPKNLKNSGKVAGTKKKKLEKKGVKNSKKRQSKAAVTKRPKEARPLTGKGDGFGVLLKTK
ncbi:MAG: superfamily II DNA/RNA helicase, partial [Porticoccus sp.]